MIPVMFGWGAQWYGNVPFWVNVKLNQAPGVRDRDAKTPVSLVTVCWTWSPLYHRTVVPAGTDRFPGENGSAADIAPGTIRTFAPCPPFETRPPMSGPAAATTRIAAITNPITANVRSPLAEYGEARWRVWATPAFHRMRLWIDRMIASTETGRAETTNQPAGYAGFENASGTANEKNRTKTIVITSPTISPHRRPSRVPAAARRKRIVNVSRISPKPPVRGTPSAKDTPRSPIPR